MQKYYQPLHSQFLRQHWWILNENLRALWEKLWTQTNYSKPSLWNGKTLFEFNFISSKLVKTFFFQKWKMKRSRLLNRTALPVTKDVSMRFNLNFLQNAFGWNFLFPTNKTKAFLIPKKLDSLPIIFHPKILWITLATWIIIWTNLLHNNI